MSSNPSEQSKNTSSGSLIGQRIGVYELTREIGRGGMGAVYLAVRADGEFDHSVAIKLIKRGMDSDLILKRFRRERQILAALNHPNIAFFYGGGACRRHYQFSAKSSGKCRILRAEKIRQGFGGDFAFQDFPHRQFERVRR